MWNCINWEFCPAWWLTWTVWPAWQWTSMASTLFRAATIAASGNLDKEIITSKPQDIQKIASCYLVWLTNSIPALITPLSPSCIGNSQAVEPWEQDMCARDHGSQEKVRWEHFWRCFPSFETIYCQVLCVHTVLSISTFFPSVPAQMPLLRSSSEDSQDLPLKTIKTSIVTLYRFKIIFR